MRLAAPQFLSDLVRDLRDRRLLPVALGLLAALVAVPVLLARSAESPPPTSPTATALPEGAVQAQPAVLSEQVGIRDYRKRLEALRGSNPFKQQFAAPQVSDGALSDAASLSAAPSVSTPSSSDAGSGGGSATQAEPQPEPSSAPAPAPEPELRFVTRRVDVKVGPRGDLTERENVRTLTVLPSKNKPVVSYLGTNEGGDKAVFLVSGDVTAVDTEGRCMPSSADCQFLVLEEGEQAKLEYGPDGQTYVLRLLAINAAFLSDSANVPDKSSKRPPLPG